MQLCAAVLLLNYLSIVDPVGIFGARMRFGMYFSCDQAAESPSFTRGSRRITQTDIWIFPSVA
jgi:hypothetical protein